MPTPSTFYINGPTLSSSTCVFSNSSLTICAPNGFYSDGTVTRELVDCVLLSPVPCPACEINCSAATSLIASGYGYFSVNVESTSVGAVIVRMNGGSSVMGYMGEYDGTFFTRLTSITYGSLHGSYTNRPTYIGRNSEMTTCGLSGKNISVNNYFYDGSSFVNNGTSQLIQALPTQLDGTVGDPYVAMMVIAKPPGGPDQYSFNMTSLCSGGNADVNMRCPQLLPQFNGGVPAASLTQVVAPVNNCENGVGPVRSYFLASITDTFPTINLYDMVFTDPYGSGICPDGYIKLVSPSTYLTPPDRVIRVQDGVVVSFHECICDPFTNPGFCS